MPDNSGLENAVEAVVAAWEKRGEFSPPGDDFELAELAIDALLSTGQLVERERLLSDEAVKKAAIAIFEDYGPGELIQAEIGIEAALHTATQ